MRTDTLKFAKGMHMYFFGHSDTPSVHENFNLITLEQCLEVTDFKNLILEMSFAAFCFK